MAELNHSEAELIRLAAAGDRHAFTRLVEQHRRMVYFLARDLCGNSEDGEDLAQEVFVKLFRNLATFRGKSSLSTWLYRVTLNSYIDRRRSRAWKAGQQTLVLEESRSPHSVHPPHQATHPESHVESEQIDREIRRALDHLSPRERAAFVLRHYRDLPIREVACALDIREGTVKSLLFRGSKKLQLSLAHLREFPKHGGIA